MIEKRLGKITNVKFGIGGYQDSMIGLHLTFASNGWGVATGESVWDPELIKWSDRCEWTEEIRDKTFAHIVRKVSKLLKQAKVDSVDQLKGIPVEVEFQGNVLKTWRILEEVL